MEPKCETLKDIYIKLQCPHFFLHQGKFATGLKRFFIIGSEIPRFGYGIFITAVKYERSRDTPTML